MQKLPYIVILFFILINGIVFSQTSPHGDGFKIECKVCHTTENWKIKDSKFDHSTTDFELVGQHQDVSCKSCHASLKFTETKQNCENCHIDIHQNSVGNDCERCHNNSSWLVSDVENIHRMSRFPLLGSHKSADCNECHISNTLLDFKPLGITCYDCHISNYQNAAKPNHILSNYSTSCEECHSINAISFSGAGIVHDFFPLAGGHSISDCYSCHQQDKFEGLSPECSSCHIETYNNTTNPSHISLGFSTDCQECHSINGWQPASFDHDAKFFPIYSGEHKSEWDDCSDCHTNSSNYAAFSCVNCHEHNLSETNGDHKGVNGYVYESNACFSCHPTGREDGSFSHTQTFPLIGSHSNVTCSECHETSFTNTSTDCNSCHTTDYENAINPNHKTSGISQQCEQCHNSTTWVPSTFSHTTTGFELVGSHVTATCSDCHSVNTSNAVSDCNSCHTTDYENAINPNHKTSGISQQCEQCHNSTTWVPATFSHTTTGFELVGSHLTATCSDCHSINTSNAVSDCNSCHIMDYNNSINPNHKGSGISQQCEQCHNSTTWVPSTFSHTTTGFELVGSHLTATCSDCHSVNTSNAVSECFSCHESNFNTAANHVSQNYPKTCEMCHNSIAWEETDFNHNLTNFPLIGSHIIVECSTCHTAGYVGTSSECASCHQTDFENAISPNHKTSGISQQCEQCHNSTTWVPSTFNHITTGFELVGSHLTATCSDCHSLNTSNAVSDCNSCHTTDYENAINPNHKTAGISQQCEQCHNTTIWVPSTFNHITTGFELVGSHLTATCSDCHSINTGNAVTDCNSCHTTDYENSVNPNHKTSGISQQCEQCHNSTTWVPSTFNHITTGFELVGSHLTATCSDCHSVNTSNAVSECFSCHESNFNTAANHVSQNYPKECEMCHNSNAWQETTFDHNSTSFPLTGSHISTDCNICHTTGYIGTSSECSSCHQTNFDNSINPNHKAVGISLLCVQCHNTTAWAPSTFNHTTTGFELVGSHVTATCSDCHSVNTSNAVSDCNSCHTTDYENAINPNHKTSGISQQCEQCHNSTTWVPSTFSHTTTGFELVGSHVTATCSDCHSINTSNAVSDCNSCHTTDYNNSINPNHKTSGISQQCEQCHNSTTWVPSTFSHTTTGFELVGSHVTATCSDCHSVNTSNAVSECFSCHESNFNTAANHVSQNYPKTCEMCHNSNTWQETTFDHNSTSFPLTGSHINVECGTCHTAGYVGTSSECSSCHQTNFDNSINPNHKTVGISLLCVQCHNSTAWVPSTFSHTTTGFELVGSHATVPCSDCHSVNTSNAVPACFSCHESNFNTAANHVSQNYPKTCEMCHNSNTWQETTFDHSSTSFPLTGSHINVECGTCHTAGYVGTSSECASCHQTNFDNSINPNHKTVGISLLCVQCHNTTAWVPSTFSHTTTGFELVGSHATVPCSDCHSVSTSNAVPACFSCHENAYNTAANHVSQNYPKECEMCHNSNTWLETTFDHNATDFPLTGSHTNLDCSSCHASGFVGTKPECSSCHQTDFDNSINPSHQTLGLSTNCETCHTTNANWEPATFSVHNNYYALLGAHATIANNCADCHNGNYTTTPNQCFGCHESEYNSTTNPAHLSAQFSTDCEACHTQSAWTPSTFDHDSQYFPIYSGEHRNEWNQCSECHTTANNYSLFSCIDCHEHNNKTEVDSDHRGVNNYQYVSTACYDCHPKGTEDGLKPILKSKILK